MHVLHNVSLSHVHYVTILFCLWMTPGRFHIITKCSLGATAYIFAKTVYSQCSRSLVRYLVGILLYTNLTGRFSKYIIRPPKWLISHLRSAFLRSCFASLMSIEYQGNDCLMEFFLVVSGACLLIMSVIDDVN